MEEVFEIDIPDIDDLQKPIEIRIGPTKSDLIKEISAKFFKFQISFNTGPKGTSAVFNFTADDRYELWDILHKVGRFRSAVIIHEGEHYEPTSYRDHFFKKFICGFKSWGVCERLPENKRWERPTNCERLWEAYIVPVLSSGVSAIMKAYLEGMKDLSLFKCGRLNGVHERDNIEWVLENLEEGTRLIPEQTFLSLASRIGDWEGVEEGRPLMPESRRNLLNIFTGLQINPALVDTAQEVVDEFSRRQITDERLIRYRVAERLNVPHYEIEESVEFALSLTRSKSVRNDVEPLGGLVRV